MFHYFPVPAGESFFDALPRRSNGESTSVNNKAEVRRCGFGQKPTWPCGNKALAKILCVTMSAPARISAWHKFEDRARRLRCRRAGRRLTEAAETCAVPDTRSAVASPASSPRPTVQGRPVLPLWASTWLGGCRGRSDHPVASLAPRDAVDILVPGPPSAAVRRGGDGPVIHRVAGAFVIYAVERHQTLADTGAGEHSGPRRPAPPRCSCANRPSSSPPPSSDIQPTSQKRPDQPGRAPDSRTCTKRGWFDPGVIRSLCLHVILELEATPARQEVSEMVYEEIPSEEAFPMAIANKSRNGSAKSWPRKRAIPLSNTLFQPDGLFRSVGGDGGERRVVAKSPLFRRPRNAYRNFSARKPRNSAAPFSRSRRPCRKAAFGFIWNTRKTPDGHTTRSVYFTRPGVRHLQIPGS